MICSSVYRFRLTVFSFSLGDSSVKWLDFFSSGHGIGRAAAQALAHDRARIVAVGRNEARGREVVTEVERLGATALFVQADVTRSSDVEAMVRQTLDAYGRLDAVINNAASIAGAFKRDYRVPQGT